MYYCSLIVLIMNIETNTFKSFLNRIAFSSQTAVKIQETVWPTAELKRVENG